MGCFYLLPSTLRKCLLSFFLNRRWQFSSRFLHFRMSRLSFLSSAIIASKCFLGSIPLNFALFFTPFSERWFQCPLIFVFLDNSFKSNPWFLHIDLILKFIILWKFASMLKSDSSTLLILINIRWDTYNLISNKIFFFIFGLIHIEKKFCSSVFVIWWDIKIDRASW